MADLLDSRRNRSAPMAAASRRIGVSIDRSRVPGTLSRRGQSRLSRTRRHASQLPID